MGTVLAMGLSISACDSDGGSTNTRDIERVCRTDQAPRVDLIVAGSGSVLPLAQRVHEQMALASPNVVVWMPESLGTSGGIAALRDGAIDIALLSRAPTSEEQAGYIVVPLAQAPSTFFVNRNGVDALRRADLVAIYRGELREWPDGTPIVPMLREPGDSGERTVATHWPDLFDAMDEARRARRWPVQSTDQEMLAALRDTPGAVGLLDVGLATGLGLAMPFIDGARPDEATLARGGWPLIRQLYAMLPDEPSEEAQRWIATLEVALNPLPTGWVPVQVGGEP